MTAVFEGIISYVPLDRAMTTSCFINQSADTKCLLGVQVQLENSLSETLGTRSVSDRNFFRFWNISVDPIGCASLIQKSKLFEHQKLLSFG